MDNATMLYRLGGMEMLHGFMVDWQIVDGHEVEQALAEGWFLTPTEAGESLRATEPDPVPTDDAPVTRAELEAKAKELGIKFDGRTTDKKLGELIAA
ncbi:MAG TPA: hypothetical protein VMA55_06400, partial [Acidovorax sp.]|nr:hypothetical protein [Acidovorax sp.]